MGPRQRACSHSQRQRTHAVGRISATESRTSHASELFCPQCDSFFPMTFVACGMVSRDDSVTYSVTQVGPQSSTARRAVINQSWLSRTSGAVPPWGRAAPCQHPCLDEGNGWLADHDQLLPRLAVALTVPSAAAVSHPTRTMHCGSMCIRPAATMSEPHAAQPCTACLTTA